MGEATPSFHTFEKVDIRIGAVVKAEPLPGARRPAYRLTIDFGPRIGVRRSSAHLTRHHVPGDLVGRRVAAMVEVASPQARPTPADVLCLGFPDQADEVVLASPDRAAPNGRKLS